MKKSTKIIMFIPAAISSVVLSALGVFLLVFIINSILDRSDPLASAEELSTLMESYYGEHQSYPLSLTDLPGISQNDILQGETRVILTVINKENTEENSYNGERASELLGPICAYHIVKQKSEFGLNPQILEKASNNRC